jgi:plasmid stability protein
MPTLTIRNIPAETHQALKSRAARSGRSMEAEARRILGASVNEKQDQAAFERAVRAAQAAFAAYRLPDLLLSEELIADRRLEAWKETVESNEAIARAAARKAAKAHGDARR